MKKCPVLFGNRIRRDDTTLMAENKELKSLLMKVKEQIKNKNMIIMRYYKDEGKNTNVKSRTVKLPELENQVSSSLQRDLEII